MEDLHRPARERITQPMVRGETNSFVSSQPRERTSQVASTNGAVKAGTPSFGKSSVIGTETRMPSSGAIKVRRHRNRATAASVALYP